MSSRVGSDKTHSLDGHTTEPVSTHTRTRSSTVSAMPSSNVFKSEFLSFGGDALKPSKLRKTSNRPQSSRARANSSTNMMNTGFFGIQSASSRRPGTADGHINGRHKSRGSVLIAATDALGLKFGRRKLSVSQHPQPIILPDVIDISAARADAETEERKRLREMAAQAIGLQPYMVSSSREESLVDEEEQVPTPTLDKTEVRMSACDAQSSFITHDRLREGSNLSVSIPHSQPPASRLRSGSVIAQNPVTTTSISPIPPYPSTLSCLMSFRQCAGTYPKYYPPSSLRIFALSKNWKQRYLMMSSPATLVTRGQSPAVSYLHLFKSGNPEEVELERLEINEDSVVFVAEDEVGGKRSVIKVGGADVGAMKKEYLINEGGYSMWLLQMQDTAQAQKWITNIKNAILSQRTVRAGLIPAYALGANEPRGDMDVMLSIRAQGIVMSVPKSSPTPPFENSSLSSRSVNSFKASGKPSGSPTGAVSALKGLFTGSRPRSASRAASIEPERQRERDLGEESFPSRGNNLLSMLRSNTPDSHTMAMIQSVPARTNSPQYVSADRLDRKILPESLPVPWEESVSLDRENAVNQTAPVEVSPLEPPPRRRWTSGLTVVSKADNQLLPCQIDFVSPSTASVTRSSIETTELAGQSGPRASSFQFGTPEQLPRASSLQSVSTYASGERRISTERSSSSTKQSSARRWSKQGMPPRPPQNDFSQAVTDQAMDRAPSPNSSRDSQRSFVSALPSFYKRMSGSDSSHSANSSGMHQNVGTNAMRARNSVPPPPRPAPTSALPPAPVPAQDFVDEVGVDDVLKPLEAVSNASRMSFRSSLNRPLRLSLVAPKPPPNTGLPPRPDEADYSSIRRLSTESSSQRYSSSLEAIPASPFPPPSGPLPPPPPPPPPLEPLPPKRIDSFKQRLRILSTGSTSNSQAFGKLRLSTARSSRASSSITTSSPSTTPIAEKIIPFPDSSFLQMYTPIMPTPPTPPTIVGQLPPQDLFPQESEIPGVTSLSPPPRRGSKQVAESDLPPLKYALVQTTEELANGKRRRTSISTPDSPRSLRSHESHTPPELTEMFTLEGWSPSPDKSSSCEILSYADSQHHVSFSHPSSLVSL